MCSCRAGTGAEAGTGAGAGAGAGTRAGEGAGTGAVTSAGAGTGTEVEAEAGELRSLYSFANVLQKRKVGDSPALKEQEQGGRSSSLVSARQLQPLERVGAVPLEPRNLGTEPPSQPLGKANRSRPPSQPLNRGTIGPTSQQKTKSPSSDKDITRGSPFTLSSMIYMTISIVLHLSLTQMAAASSGGRTESFETSRGGAHALSFMPRMQALHYATCFLSCSM